jgi:hypothetical protein
MFKDIYLYLYEYNYYIYLTSSEVYEKNRKEYQIAKLKKGKNSQSQMTASQRDMICKYFFVQFFT